MDILVLGASYGSLFATKCLMAGHNVTLICTSRTAELINSEGTEVRIKLRGEDEHRSICSRDYKGSCTAVTPDQSHPYSYDLIVLAMQEPQYAIPDVKNLMKRIARSGRPVLSIMNHPPLAYLRRIHKLAHVDLSSCYTDAEVWDEFDPALVSLCSPDPQAFRPPDEPNNVLHVGLPTNFKAAAFGDRANTNMLRQLELDIANVTLEGKDVPVKLRVYDSLFVPMAKWSMLCAGNYRCVLDEGAQSINSAVHSNLGATAMIYSWVVEVAQQLGAELVDTVPFHKYAHAADNLLKPSSVARAIEAGSSQVERVDKLVQLVARSLDMQNDELDRIVKTVDNRLLDNVSLAV
jgi:hypothetical protein